VRSATTTPHIVLLFLVFWAQLQLMAQKPDGIKIKGFHQCHSWPNFWMGLWAVTNYTAMIASMNSVLRVITPCANWFSV